MSSRFHKITYLLGLYQQQHNIKTISKESQYDICQRKFVYNNFWSIQCDNINNNQGIGNIIGQFLNKFAMAFIFNYTFIKGDNDNLESNCMEYIKFRKWLPSYQEISHYLELADCPIDFNKDTIDITNPYISYNDSLYHNRSFTISLYNPTESYCAFDSNYGYLLDTISRQRADLLFSSPYPATYGTQGRFEGFGLLFRSGNKYDINNIDIV